MHPNLEPLAFLLGTWRGTGEGEYPTIEPFSYAETIWFEAGPGKPWISYRQATRRVGGEGEPLHAEFGYLRALGSDRLELVIAQPTGIAEVHSGTLDGGQLTFRSERVTGSETAKEVTAVERIIEIEGDVLTYRMAMAAVGLPLTHHLAARLERLTGEGG
jgi:hypothetical protein